MKGFFTSFFVFLLVLQFSGALAANSAFAEVSQKDFKVIVRALGFIENPPSGDVSFVILYNPSDAVSVKEGKALLSSFGDAYKVGNMVLRPRLVSVSDIDAVGKASFVFVTSGTAAVHGQIARLTKTNKVLSMSVDRQCIESGDCMFYVNTDNRVEILVNKETMDRAGLSFKSNFMLLVKTI